jgi:hypothetical protein
LCPARLEILERKRADHSFVLATGSSAAERTADH